MSVGLQESANIRLLHQMEMKQMTKKMHWLRQLTLVPFNLLWPMTRPMKWKNRRMRVLVAKTGMTGMFHFYTFLSNQYLWIDVYYKWPFKLFKLSHS
jgi:hypothetical protein